MDEKSSDGIEDGIKVDVDQRTPDHPLNAERRPFWVPLVLTGAVLALVIGIFVLITFVADYSATTP